jgi:hypothetical protein
MKKPLVGFAPALCGLLGAMSAGCTTEVAQPSGSSPTGRPPTVAPPSGVTVLAIAARVRGDA